MPNPTKRFAWQDRDTAARDLLQLASVAPESLRRRALQLLKAFRSSAIRSDLEQIVLDEKCNGWERRYALRAIAAIPGDNFLPEFARFATASEDSMFDDSLFDDLLRLASSHPRNLQWVFREVEQQDPKVYLQVLNRSTNYFRQGEDLNPILCRRMIEVLEAHPLLLDLKLIGTLYFQDGSESTLEWLHERWDTLIYLCLVGEAKDVFRLLKNWDQLREAVFKNCPSMIEEYKQQQLEVAALRLRFRPAPVDYQSSAVWQELNAWHQAALAGDQQAYGKLARVVYHEQNDLCKRAVATNLLGKLKHQYDVRPALFHALRHAPDDAKYNDLAMSASIRFEAGEALRDIPSPEVWETMIDAFFIRPQNVLESFLSDWIAYLTDRLSGIDAPYSGIKWGDENERFWFRALAESNDSQEEDALS
ncbi:MAG: hypothetical protein H7175_14100 [Burkholderiales bacterium]|nr:hypothetical protein [Anaerolineae bacterium]